MDESPAIPRVVQLADQIRTLRRLQKQFLTMWAIDGTARRLAGGDHAEAAAIADPFNRDWSILYRGSVLDD
jgi:hypothetical protein